MTLQDWRNFGWLKDHETSSQEIADLLAVADRDLADSQTPALSAQWRLNIAYNAALQCATPALAAAGFRPGPRESHHVRAIQSLEDTIRAHRTLIDQFDAFRKKRNLGGYERVGVVSDQEADEMIELAKELRSDVEAWLRAYHPALLEE